MADIKTQLEGGADDYGNDGHIEMQWAVKAYHHLETYLSLLTAVKEPAALRLTRQDDEIYRDFRATFGQDYPVQVVNEDLMKSKEGKETWRQFCERYKDLPEYNTGSLLRVDCRLGMTQENTVFATRIQFLAIEIARNREGLNDGVRDIVGPPV